jgi:tRNA (cmo5U34)-methyltransferase
MTNAGDGLNVENADWRFRGEVVKQFDNHILKSVPLYKEGHSLIVQLGDFFIKDDSVCYDLGCSTGEIPLALAQRNRHRESARFIGIDNESDMIEEAERKLAAKGISSAVFQFEDILQYDFSLSDLISAYYTIQFVRPSVRQQLIDKVYKSLNWGGAFIMFEKVRGPDARFQDILTALYNDYKIEQGYTAEEVVGKSRSLKGVLEPFSTQGNLEMLRRAGFNDIVQIMRFVCFEGYLAIK